MRTLKEMPPGPVRPGVPESEPPEVAAEVPAAPPDGPATSPEPPSLEDVYDSILARLGFDSEHPGWFETLRQLHRHSRNRHLQLVPDFFYSAVFAPGSMERAVWDGTFPECGRFDLEEQRAFLRATPSRGDELLSLSSGTAPAGSGFDWGNAQFGHADAALYYALVRRFRPGRIVEVGGGHSTTLALHAVAANGAGRVVCIDPHAPESLRSLTGLEVEAVPVQDAPDSIFLSLQPSDMLFIDGSHISKTGSDVNHLFLRILPRLPSGVLVHVHDVCLPFEYPKAWSEDSLCYWNEQYVLAALLANSAKYEVLLGTYFIGKLDPSLLLPFLPDLPGVFPGGASLWIRSRE